QLRGLSSALAARAKAEVEAVRQRLQNARLPADHPAHQRLAPLLEQGDVLTANEYLDSVLGGQRLPEARKESDPFAEFFPTVARSLDEFLHQTPPTTVVGKVRNREAIDGIDLKAVPVAQAGQAADLLEAWFAASRAQRLEEAGATAILSGLGFNPQRGSVPPSRRRDHPDVLGEPAPERERWPGAG